MKKSIHVCDIGPKLKTERKPLFWFSWDWPLHSSKFNLSCSSLFVIFIVITAAVSHSGQTKSEMFISFLFGVAESQQILQFSTFVPTV